MININKNKIKNILSKNLSKKFIYLKGFLFFVIAIVGFFYCLLLNYNLIFFLILSITIWASCRFYYFMFYVITNYVDNKYKFSGIIDFLSYLLKKK